MNGWAENFENIKSKYGMGDEKGKGIGKERNGCRRVYSSYRLNKKNTTALVSLSLTRKREI